jgi:hypothetical protein
MAITRYAVRTLMDNYEPARGETWFTAEVYTGEDNARDPESFTVVLCQPTELRDATRAVYVWDDGQTVVPLYVAGYQPDASSVYLCPYPLANGRRRPDNGRPIDFSTWVLGPRRSYHLKARAVDMGEDNV